MEINWGAFSNLFSLPALFYQTVNQITSKSFSKCVNILVERILFTFAAPFVYIPCSPTKILFTLNWFSKNSPTYGTIDSLKTSKTPDFLILKTKTVLHGVCRNIPGGRQIRHRLFFICIINSPFWNCFPCRDSKTPKIERWVIQIQGPHLFSAWR